MAAFRRLEEGSTAANNWSALAELRLQLPML